MAEAGLRVLISEVQAVKESLGRILEDVERFLNEPYDETTKAIKVGYKLASLYTAAGDLFRSVARYFENTVEDLTRWHRELLWRMSLAVEGVRREVISRESFQLLDELRRFRHFFAHAYDVDLDFERIAYLARKTLKQKDLLMGDLEGFQRFLLDLLEQR